MCIGTLQLDSAHGVGLKIYREVVATGLQRPGKIMRTVHNHQKTPDIHIREPRVAVVASLPPHLRLLVIPHNMLPVTSSGFQV